MSIVFKLTFSLTVEKLSFQVVQLLGVRPDVRTNPITTLPAVTYRSAGKSVKRHIGIDYCLGNGKKIVSLIHGKIIAKGWISSDGLSLLVQRDSPGNRKNYLYLFG